MDKEEKVTRRELERKIWQLRERLDEVDAPLEWLVGGWWNASDLSLLRMENALAMVLKDIQHLARTNREAVIEAKMMGDKAPHEVDRILDIEDILNGKHDRLV